MATSSPNVSVTATSFNTGQVLFNATGKPVNSVASTDAPCRAYGVHNRDAANYGRVAILLSDGVTWLVAGSDGGAAIPPLTTVPFANAAGSIVLVIVWNEGTTVVMDGFVEAR